MNNPYEDFLAKNGVMNVEPETKLSMELAIWLRIYIELEGEHLNNWQRRHLLAAARKLEDIDEVPEALVNLKLDWRWVRVAALAALLWVAIGSVAAVLFGP